MSSSQANVSRKKVISSQESSLRRDETKKKTLQKEEEKNVISVSNRKSKNDKSLIKHNSVGNSTSQTKTSTDKTVNKNVKSSSVSSISKTSSTVSNKILASSSINEIKTKLRKQSSDEKRGVSTIYMPKKSVSTSKQSSQATVKTNKDPGKSSDKSKNNDENKSKEKSTAKSKEYSRETSGSKNRLPSRERRKSRTLSPSEVKMLNRNLNNYVDVSSFKKKLAKRDPSPEYEDDFEDYESDFQQCTDSEASEEKSSNDTSSISESEESSTSSEAAPVELQNQTKNNEEKRTVLPRKYVEEEKMLDSGHYELQEARRRAARIDLMSASRSNRVPVLQRPIFVQDPAEKEVRSEVKSLPSSADEGFEEGRSGDFVKSPPISGSMSQVVNPQINSDKKLLKPKSEAVETSKEEIKVSKYLIRGRQLLQMIKLDRVSWSLYESTPIPYEDFIRIHGKINTRQISTQTNEDNLSVDIQTEEIECRNMWTQYPIVCRSVLNTNNDIKMFTRELVGVGSDDADNDDLNPHQNRIYYDVLQLNGFILNAGKLMLALLEGKSSAKINFSKHDTYNLSFSEGSIKLSVASVTFLANRPVTLIRYTEISHKILLTIHEHADEDVETAIDEDSYMTDCYIGCLWNIFDPSKPVKIFYSSSNICACCFHPTNYNIIFAGLEDGTLSLWDLGENEFYHRRVIDKENKLDWVIRSPTFTSGGNFDENETESSKIVALTVLSRINNDPGGGGGVTGKFMPVEVCSLNEKGCCEIWSVVKNFEGSVTDDLGQSWWGKLRLLKSHEISLNMDKGMQENFMQEFKDICMDCVNVNSLYISCNTNKILHATRIGKRAKPQFYIGDDITGGITCIEKCPFNQSCFLVGCEDGNICLFSSKREKPLVQLKNPNSTAAIKIIQWSRSKPLIIYVLNVESKIYIWDLSKSDIFPTCSITLEKYGHVDSMQLSPCRSNHDLINQYMTLGFNNGSVEIHKLNQQFHYSNRDDISSELKVLLKYLSIC